MKKYNVKNYIRYKEDLKLSMPTVKPYAFYTREELIIKFMPLVENISRKFATSQQASGVMSINDIIQEGNLNLTKAVDKIDWEKVSQSDNIEQTLKSFLSKRIRGGIRRAVDANPSDENMVYQIPDKSDPYNETLLNSYIMSLLNKHLEWNEMLVLSKSYGLDGPKWSASDIAKALELKGTSAYVRVSELKKQAVQKLIDNVDHSQVLDYL